MPNLGRSLGPIAIALLALLPVALGGACATAVQTGAGGGNTGGGSGSSAGQGGSGIASSSSGGPGHDAGLPGPCTMATDCASMNDPCNVGACVNGTCVKAPANEHGSCDDGLFCTDNDSCINGVCVGGNAKSCAPPDSCHIGLCDEATDTCTSMPGNDGAQCDDMDACTLAGTCSNGVCAKGTPVDCSVLNGTCSVGTCVPGQGCVAMPVNDGTACNDGLYCTINDHCQAGKCTGDPNICAPPNNPCLIGVCNEATKSCSTSSAPNGTACSDGNICKSGQTCNSGQCTGGQAANNGMMCDDSNACTTGTSCSAGTCSNPQSQIVQCVSGDGCCPANCTFANDSDCLYWTSGVLQNVPPAMLAGWQTCYTDNYAVAMDDPKVDQILQQCSKGRLMLACRKVGAANYQLAAMGLRADVLFDCGMNSACTHVANGVGWYFSKQYSWGFAGPNDAVARNQCDVNSGPLRLCWHTLNGVGGYRCGDTTGLNSDATWERDVLQAD